MVTKVEDCDDDGDGEDDDEFNECILLTSVYGNVMAPPSVMRIAQTACKLTLACYESGA